MSIEITPKDNSKWDVAVNGVTVLTDMDIYDIGMKTLVELELLKNSKWKSRARGELF